jgi:hypothetical protein
MSVSTIACGFISYKHYVGGRPCGNDATHRVLGDTSMGEVAIDLCRDHWLYTTGAYPVCGLCGNSKYSDVRVIQREHTCYEGDRGWDCMHFENDEHCDCEGTATLAFDEADRTPVVPVAAVMPEGWECEECQDGDAFCSDADSPYCDMCNTDRANSIDDSYDDYYERA